LVTLIEIASPANKRPGPDRRAYEAKQQEILDNDAPDPPIASELTDWVSDGLERWGS
jgi:hypothetical protein